MNDCIEWPGHRIKGGYGRIKRNGKNLLVHRIAYCEHHRISMDEIAGMEIRHTCDNPPCVNPDHLIIGTHTDNMRDMHSRGRNAPTQRESNGHAKLSETQIAEIRETYIRGNKEFGQVALAEKYNIHQTQISRIILRKQWP